MDSGFRDIGTDTGHGIDIGFKGTGMGIVSDTGHAHVIDIELNW
jgi:hypothetical protein